jgi:hypothetical protein
MLRPTVDLRRPTLDPRRSSAKHPELEPNEGTAERKTGVIQGRSEEIVAQPVPFDGRSDEIDLQSGRVDPRSPKDQTPIRPARASELRRRKKSTWCPVERLSAELIEVKEDGGKRSALGRADVLPGRKEKSVMKASKSLIALVRSMVFHRRLTSAEVG